MPLRRRFPEFDVRQEVQTASESGRPYALWRPDQRANVARGLAWHERADELNDVKSSSPWTFTEPPMRVVTVRCGGSIEPVHARLPTLDIAGCYTS